MSVFDELLAIKRFREGQAEIAVSRQRLRHSQADAQWRDAATALASFRDSAQRRESAMYDDLCSRVVRVRDIEDVLLGVAGLREAERRREQAVEAAAQQLQQESVALAASRQQHQQAVRLTGKFVELASLHLDEHLKTLERKEDQEMEEAASVVRDREDWEQHEEFEPA
ncbi:YscO family type III secretion system apparatus protein [Achromobacter sp. Bel]|uniref:type III secretion system stalk subunit SctO n=1 Tax=Achromobacter sp. Bel TaxID=2727415 RepID=UPI00145E8393|nr:YscO family type III secretion system apparatus protein [Achromobacter sp. Bel]NMK50031.1 YscO family type III secretion system apparatus protein [Achromobacter sp. Bel]